MTAHYNDVVGFWRQRTTFTNPAGQAYEIPGLGCSWFQYAGNREWAWQRDIFDAGLATTMVGRIFRDKTNSPELDQRVAAVTAGNMPGHYPDLESLSAPLWPVPVNLR